MTIFSCVCVQTLLIWSCDHGRIPQNNKCFSLHALPSPHPLLHHVPFSSLHSTWRSKKLRRRMRISLPSFSFVFRSVFLAAENGGGDGEMRTANTRFDRRRRNLCSTVIDHLPFSTATPRSVCRGGEGGRRGDDEGLPEVGVTREKGGRQI